MTLTRTVEPFGTDWPADGSVAVTWPFVLPPTKCSSGFSPKFVRVASAWVHCWPTTAGTVTFGGPFETVSVTVPPFGSFEPAAGSCLKTIPALNLSFEALFTTATRPAAWICCSADASGSFT